MKINIKKLVVCIAIPLAVGGVAAFLTRGAVTEFATIEKPPFAPPAWLFSVVWTILYTLMGISSYLISESKSSSDQKEQAITLYFYQLVVNFLWPIFFFNFGWYLFSFFWLVLLWVLVYQMIKQFLNINKIAGYLNIPYLIWLTVAAYLNFGIWWLNR
ncbi:MAG: tryptophan-rich sensory protein [Lachnospiraceae bacterium]|nr:tryptophan-rich sensory protein [Lachnospiraceae bacterium]